MCWESRPAFTAKYNGDGLRAVKQLGSEKTLFLYDGTDLLGKYDVAGALQWLNTWGPTYVQHTTLQCSIPYAVPTMETKIMERAHSLVRTIALLVFFLTLLISFLVISARAWNNSQRVAMYSCVASIRSELLKRESHGFPLEGKSGEAWESITGVEQTRLIQQITADGNLDCAMLHVTPRGVLDAWGEPILIAERYRQGHNAEFIVASKGPDKTPMTADDIVAPQHEDWPSGLWIP